MTILLALALLAPAVQEAPPPQAVRFDEVGMAARLAAGEGAFIVHPALPPGSFAEVTALDSGRTILLYVREHAALPPDRVAELSPGAAAALELTGAPLLPIRIRPILPAPQEQASLRGGGSVRRLDAPEALLVALRRRLPARAQPSREMARHAVVPPRAASPMARPPLAPPKPVATPKAPAAPAAPAGRWFVQVAALSDPTRANALAKSVGGVVRRAGALYRVQAGPFATRAAADAARAALARRGFGDARTTQSD